MIASLSGVMIAAGTGIFSLGVFWAGNQFLHLPSGEDTEGDSSSLLLDDCAATVDLGINGDNLVPTLHLITDSRDLPCRERVDWLYNNLSRDQYQIVEEGFLIERYYVRFLDPRAELLFLLRWPNVT
jgi:hypothetical protein